MPKFPACHGNIPRYLSLWKPQHYALLAYWVYFRPTQFKCYVHQALPGLYSPDPAVQPGFFQRWGHPAFRNLFLMVPTTAAVVSLLLSFPVTSISSWILDVPVNWEQWREGLMFGVGIGMTIGMASGMVGRMIGGNVLGLMMGVTFGVTIGVLGAMTGSVALGISFANLTDAAIVVSAVFGVMGGMAATLDIEIGVAVCLTFLIIGAMSFGAEFIVYHLFGTRFGALLARGMMSGAFIAGAFRVLLYPFQCALAFFSFLPGVHHPLDWDELIVLPLPWTRTMLFQRLRKNEDRGLQCLAEVWRNLFCRPAIQAVFYRYLHKHRQPFRFLYGLLRNPDLEAYMLIPMTSQQWEHNVSVLQVMLGELALHHVEATHNPRFHRSAWWLNLHIYKRRPHTPLTRFAGMLCDLLEHQTVETDGFDLAAYARVYRNVFIYPDGKEIEVSFSAMATCLGYQDLAAVAAAQTMVTEIEAHICLHKTIRPSVFIALTYLSQIGTDIAHYHEAATNPAKLAALAHATGRLNDLNAYVCAEVTIPERGLLQRIVQQWQQLIVSEIGEIGKLEESQKEVTAAQAVVSKASTRSKEEQKYSKQIDSIRRWASH